jgi:hypothetical protein
MTTTTDTTAQTNDYLIRALYSAKAVFKNAASSLTTANHNLYCLTASSYPQAEIDAAELVRSEEEARYEAAHKTYEAIWKLCNKMGLCG